MWVRDADWNTVQVENLGQLVVVARLSVSQRKIALRIPLFDLDARSSQASEVTKQVVTTAPEATSQGQQASPQSKMPRNISTSVPVSLRPGEEADQLDSRRCPDPPSEPDQPLPMIRDQQDQHDPGPEPAIGSKMETHLLLLCGDLP